MLLLIEITVPEQNAEVMQRNLERCCAETGDRLLGRRVYKETGETLLIVRLMKDTYLTEHTRVLTEALKQGLVLSFQPATFNLIKLWTHAPDDIQALIMKFPLYINESWFPAIVNEQVLYVCTRKHLLAPDQAVWLCEHEIQCQYI